MIEEVKDKLDTFSLPAKPKTFGVEYSFPEEVGNLSSIELGTWMFKLAAWKGYAIRMLANAEISRAGLKAKHDNRLARRIAESNINGLKVTKDQALGQLIIGDEDFKEVRVKLTVKDAEVDSLKQVVEIYSFQVDVISREISRRALDVKIKQLGITNRED